MWISDHLSHLVLATPLVEAMVSFLFTQEKVEAGSASVPKPGSRARPQHGTASPVLQAAGVGWGLLVTRAAPGTAYPG